MNTRLRVAAAATVPSMYIQKICRTRNQGK